MHVGLKGTVGMFLACGWLSVAHAEPEVKHVTANGADFAYVEAGRGDPLLLIHGGGADFRFWDSRMAVLSKDRRVIAYSRRNHFPNAVSAEDTPDNNGDIHGEDAAALIGMLGLSRVQVIGHSSGALTALYLAANHPDLVRTLVVNEPNAVGLGGTKSLLADATVEAFRSGNLERAVPLFFDTTGGPRTWERKSEAERRINMDNALSMAADYLSSRPRPLFTCEMAQRIRAPTLLLNGERSPEFFHRIIGELKRCVPSNEHIVIPLASHNTFDQNPKAVDEVVFGFLARH